MPAASAAIMRPKLLIALLIAFISSLALAAEPERTVDILAWPLSASTAHPLASVSYNSTSATLHNYRAPHLAASDEIVRVGFSRPGTGAWSGVATAASNFAAARDKKIVLHLDSAGELYHVGFRASDVATSGSGKGSSLPAEGVSVEVAKIAPGPAPLMNTPVVLDEHGEVPAKEPEKSFIQKYWWIGVAFLVFQLVAASGKD